MEYPPQFKADLLEALATGKITRRQLLRAHDVSEAELRSWERQAASVAPHALAPGDGGSVALVPKLRRDASRKLGALNASSVIGVFPLARDVRFR
jgi:transposase-like protein